MEDKLDNIRHIEPA